MSRFGTHVVLLFTLAALVGGCDWSEDSDPIRILIPREVSSSQYETTENGVQYYDFEAGDGAAATDSSRLRVHYAAWLTDASLISNSYESDNPLLIDLASGTVVLGLEEGIPGMREGGERQLIVPPELAYGEEGRPQAGIPPNATIIYEIRLLEVEVP